MRKISYHIILRLGAAAVRKKHLRHLNIQLSSKVTKFAGFLLLIFHKNGIKTEGGGEGARSAYP